MTKGTTVIYGKTTACLMLGLSEVRVGPTTKKRVYRVVLDDGITEDVDNFSASQEC